MANKAKIHYICNDPACKLCSKLIGKLWAAAIKRAKLAELIAWQNQARKRYNKA